MKRIQIFQGDISIEMIPSGIFINCHGAYPCPWGKIKQLAPGETGQSLQTFQFEAWHLQPTKTWKFSHVFFAPLHSCMMVHYCFIYMYNMGTYGIGLSHRERERELFILLRHARINMFCDMMCTCRWCGFVHIETYFYCPLQLYRPWTCVQTLEWPLLTGVYSKPGSNLWVQRSWTLRAGQAAR